jgi:hypothetical protein
MSEPIEQWSNDGREKCERDHRDQQVEGDSPAGLTGGHVEEDRAGEADGDERIAGAGDRVQVKQPHHAGVADATAASCGPDISGHPPRAARRSRGRCAHPAGHGTSSEAGDSQDLSDVARDRHAHILTHPSDPSEHDAATGMVSATRRVRHLGRTAR